MVHGLLPIKWLVLNHDQPEWEQTVYQRQHSRSLLEFRPRRDRIVNGSLRGKQMKGGNKLLLKLNRTADTTVEPSKDELCL